MTKSVASNMTFTARAWVAYAQIRLLISTLERGGQETYLKICPWSSRIIAIVDIHQLHSNRLYADVDGLNNKKQCYVR